MGKISLEGEDKQHPMSDDIKSDPIKNDDIKSNHIKAAFAPVIEQLQTIVDSNPAFRSLLHTLGQALIALTAEPHPSETAPQAEPNAATVASPVLVSAVEMNGAAPPPATEQPLLTPEPVRLVARPAPPPPPVSTWRPAPTVTDEDLPTIATRCRLKAEGTRWAAARQAHLMAGAENDLDSEIQGRDLIARAKPLPDCFLWMCHRDGPVTTNMVHYEELAGCFDAAAAAVSLLDKLLQAEDDDQDAFAGALDFAAEAQSALRSAVYRMDGYTDSDQAKLFHWLRLTSAEQHIHIHRFMRRDNPADPSGWAQLGARIEQFEEKLQVVGQRAKRQQSLLNKLRYHVKLIHEHPSQERLYDWQKVIDTVNEMVENGVPPSNRDLRDLLYPLLDAMPDLELPKSFQLVVREIDRFLASRPAKPDIVAVAAPTEEVQRVAELLRGRTAVLIGGEKRVWAVEALTEAFALQELVWIEGHDQSYADFEPQVARPEVAVVILAIRWSRHGFGEVKAFCDQYDKLLVRLPGGYNPNLVAHHILNQVGARLDKAGVTA